MKAQIKAVEAFVVQVGGVDLGMFVQASKWEGLAKLQNSSGDTLIVILPSAGSIASAISRVFGNHEDITVVMASPNLHDRLGLQAGSGQETAAKNCGGPA